jgi:type II secretion system protein N
VKKVSKAILIGLAVVAILGGALVVGLNLYIQSPGAQARIQEELSKALRVPLKITNTSVTPWSDLRFSGISIPNGDANFLEATSFSASYRLLPLFDGKLIITEMRVENPQVIWSQNAEGKWKLPEPEEAAAIAEQAAPVPPPETVAVPEPAIPEASPVPEKVVAKKEKAKREAKKKDFAVIINRFEVKNGAFDLLDKDRRPVAVFSGVQMIYTTLTEEKVEGTATIGKVVWSDGLTLENVRTPFSFLHQDRELSLPEITATLGGGALRGRYLSRAQGKQTIFNSAVKFDRVGLDPLFTQTGGEAGQVSGELDGDLEVRGESGRKDKLTGMGRLTLRDGRFRQLGLFQTIGEVFNIRSLADFRVREGQAELHLSGDKILVERIQLDATDLQVSAKGTIRLDKRVNLEAQLAAEETLLQSIPSIFTDNFVRGEDGRRAIAFNVTGTTDKLRTDFVEKLRKQTLESQLGGLLGNIFGNEKKEEEKKKKEEEERKKAEKRERKKKEAKDKGALLPNASPAVADAAPTSAPASRP